MSGRTDVVERLRRTMGSISHPLMKKKDVPRLARSIPRLADARAGSALPARRESPPSGAIANGCRRRLANRSSDGAVERAVLVQDHFSGSSGRRPRLQHDPSVVQERDVLRDLVRPSVMCDATITVVCRPRRARAADRGAPAVDDVEPAAGSSRISTSAPWRERERERQQLLLPPDRCLTSERVDPEVLEER